MAGTKKQEVRKRRKNVLEALIGTLKNRDASLKDNAPEGARLEEIYKEMQKRAGKEIGVTEQTIGNDLKELSRKILPRPFEGKVKKTKVKGKIEWLYVEPKPASFAAYGYRWKRDSVDWNEKEFEGEKKKGKKAERVDFAGMAGVYLLHNGDRTVYVGRVQGGKNRGLKNRLREHTEDKLEHDWDKFSWFGFNEVKNGTVLEERFVPPLIEEEDQLSQVITMIEAIVINGIRPSKNARGGDVHNDVHYRQVVNAGKK